MNVIEIKGTLHKDPGSGKKDENSWANIFLMVDDVLDSGENKGKEIKVGIPFVAFGDIAEKVAELKKGDSVHLKAKIWRHKSKGSWMNDLVITEVL